MDIIYRFIKLVVYMEIKISLTVSQLELNGLKEMNIPGLRIKHTMDTNRGQIYWDATHPKLFFVVLECDRDFGLREGANYLYNDFLRLVTNGNSSS